MNIVVLNQILTSRKYLAKSTYNIMRLLFIVHELLSFIASLTHPLTDIFNVDLFANSIALHEFRLQTTKRNCKWKVTC